MSTSAKLGRRLKVVMFKVNMSLAGFLGQRYRADRLRGKPGRAPNYWPRSKTGVVERRGSW